jgi:hypothetical protein
MPPRNLSPTAQAREWSHAAFMVSFYRHSDICSPPVLTGTPRSRALNRALPSEKNGFRYWPDACNESSEMKTRRHLEELGQKRRLDNTVRGLGSSQTLRPRIDHLAATFPAAATQIGREEK